MPVPNPDVPLGPPEEPPAHPNSPGLPSRIAALLSSFLHLLMTKEKQELKMHRVGDQDH